MPSPSLRILTSAASPTTSTDTSIDESGEEYLKAFDRRFDTICPTRKGSACTRTGASGRTKLVRDGRHEGALHLFGLELRGDVPRHHHEGLRAAVAGRHRVARVPDPALRFVAADEAGVLRLGRVQEQCPHRGDSRVLLF